MAFKILSEGASGGILVEKLYWEVSSWFLDMVVDEADFENLKVVQYANHLDSYWPLSILVSTMVILMYQLLVITYACRHWHPSLSSG